MNISRSPNVGFFDSLLGFAHPKEFTHKRRFVLLHFLSGLINTLNTSKVLLSLSPCPQDGIIAQIGFLGKIWLALVLSRDINATPYESRGSLVLLQINMSKSKNQSKLIKTDIIYH